MNPTLPRSVEHWPRKLLIAMPRGYCAGVVRAVDALWEFHKRNQKRNPSALTYCFHQIIHNVHVVREFEEAGVIFVNDIADVPDESYVMLSPHGVAPEVIRTAREKKLKYVDVTCPLVEKPHREVRRLAAQGFTVLYVGHASHDETVGTMGEAPGNVLLIQTVEDARNVAIPDPDKVALTTQTTLSLDDTARIREVLKARYPQIIEPPKEDICYATTNRQTAVKEMVTQGADVVVVVGSANSSNSQRLSEVADAAGARAYLIDDSSELEESPFVGVDCVGVTSGASVPEGKFQEVVAWFLERGSAEVSEAVVADESRITFAPPKQLYEF